MRFPVRAVLSVTCGTVLVVGGCGGGEGDNGEDSSAADSHSHQSDHSSNDVTMGDMNEPDATPANELADAQTKSGRFHLLDTAPPAIDHVTGRAWLAQHDAGTTVTIKLSGLTAGKDYVSHLHEKPCNQDDGGDHFAFNPDGPEKPPNEVHLAFTADKEGHGRATVTNDRRVGDGAKSVVVHPAEMTDNRVACADF